MSAIRTNSPMRIGTRRGASCSGTTAPQAPEEDENAIKLKDEWEVVPDDRGHRVPRTGVEEDEESVGEHLVADGRRRSDARSNAGGPARKSRSRRATLFESERGRDS